MLVRWHTKVPKRIQPVDLGATVPRLGFIQPGADHYDTPRVPRMQILAHVAGQIKAIEVDERINADPFLFDDLKCLQAGDHAYAPADDHNALASAPHGMSNHVGNLLIVMQLLPWIEIDSIVAAGSEFGRQLPYSSHTGHIAIGADENDE